MLEHSLKGAWKGCDVDGEYSDEELDYVGDVQILGLLEASRIAFESGEKSELMKCVYRCARFQAVLPEWAADALLALQEDLESGRTADYNEAFGKPKEKVSTRAARARKLNAKPRVMAELWRLRCVGNSLNDADMFPQALENLRSAGLYINHRDIQELYAEHGDFLKTMPRHPDPNMGRGFMDVTYPKARRRGRNILRD